MNPDDRNARVAGLLYLLFIPTAGLAFGFGQFLLTGDVATVFANIESHRRFFELAIFLGTVGFIDYIVVALLLYRLLAPAGRAAATLMVALVAVSVPISLAAMAARMDVLTMLDSRHLIGALNDDQLKAQVLLVVRHADNLLLVSAMFWGLWLVPYGWLVYRSCRASSASCSCWARPSMSSHPSGRCSTRTTRPRGARAWWAWSAACPASWAGS